jgi:hypothetical protein
MEYIAVTAFLAAALSGFMWLLTRNDHSSVFWAQEVRRITAPGSGIAPSKSGSMRALRDAVFSGNLSDVCHHPLCCGPATTMDSG